MGHKKECQLFSLRAQSDYRLLMDETNQDHREGRAKKGRPRKPDAERRRHVLRVRYNDAELQRVETKARDTGVSVSEYIRGATLGMKLSPKANAATRHELRRIGINLNQLARAAHRGTMPAEPLSAALGALDATLRRL